MIHCPFSNGGGKIDNKPSPVFPKLVLKKTIQILLVGGFNPSEKYESQMGLLFPIYGKIN
jgi:hypothetical protein